MSRYFPIRIFTILLSVIILCFFLNGNQQNTTLYRYNMIPVFLLFLSGTIGLFIGVFFETLFFLPKSKKKEDYMINKTPTLSHVFLALLIYACIQSALFTLITLLRPDMYLKAAIVLLIFFLITSIVYLIEASKTNNKEPETEKKQRKQRR